MSHMTVTVALPGDTAVGDLWAALEAALAPYDENIDVDPYVRYSKAEVEADEKFQEWWKGAKALAAESGMDVTYPKAVSEWYGGDVDKDGNVLSRYNPDTYELVVCGGGEGREVDQSTWDEVLLDVLGTPTARVLPESVPQSRWPVHLVYAMHPSAQQGADARAETELGAAVQVRDNAAAVRGDARGAGVEVRDLPNEGIEPGPEIGAVRGGSLSRDRQGAFPAVLKLQLYVGRGEGRCVHVDCGDPVPHGAHTVATRLIGGSQWDWWVVGGRWAGGWELADGAERALESEAGINYPDAINDRRRGDAARKSQIAGEVAPSFAYLALDGEWHERGRMGWWAIVDGEKPESEWGDEFKGWLDGLPDDTWLVNVDAHI